jgi:glutathione S-transferase
MGRRRIGDNQGMEASTPAIALYDWGPSPFCMKVRAVLDLKGLPYRRLPALAHARELRRRGGVGKVPALDLDGELQVDSTDIVHLLERRFPARPVLPADPRDRARCHVLEEYADEALYFFGLYYHWHEPQGRARARAYFHRSWLGRLAFPVYLRRVERQLRGHGITRKSPEHVRADLIRNLDAIEGLLAGREFLLDGGPYLCDLAVAAQLRYLTLAASMKDVLDGYPACEGLLARLPAIKA